MPFDKMVENYLCIRCWMVNFLRCLTTNRVVAGLLRSSYVSLGAATAIVDRTTCIEAYLSLELNQTEDNVIILRQTGLIDK
jgi:hypothetical protein